MIEIVLSLDFHTHHPVIGSVLSLDFRAYHGLHLGQRHIGLCAISESLNLIYVSMESSVRHGIYELSE